MRGRLHLVHGLDPGCYHYSISKIFQFKHKCKLHSRAHNMGKFQLCKRKLSRVVWAIVNNTVLIAYVFVRSFVLYGQESP